VLVDNGSGLNICTLTLIKYLGYFEEALDPNTITIKAYDNAERELVGTIHLPIMVRPVMQRTMLHVIDLELPYNILLERPWIHALQAIPSTFHQCLKFTHEGEEVTILGDPQPFQYCRMMEGRYRKTNHCPTIEGAFEMNESTISKSTKSSSYIHPDDLPSMSKTSPSNSHFRILDKECGDYEIQNAFHVGTLTTSS